MSNAITRNMEKMNPLKILSTRIPLNFVAEGQRVEEARTVVVSYMLRTLRASMEERLISQLKGCNADIFNHLVASGRNPSLAPSCHMR